MSDLRSLDAIDEAVNLVKASRILADRRMVEAFGHASVRIGNLMLITPGASLDSVVEADLVVVDQDGQRVGGGENMPLEAPLHLAVYRHRADVRGIARTHSHALSVFAVTDHPIRPVHDLGAVVPTEVPILDDPSLIATQELGDVAAEALGDHAALLLRGNGALTVGSDIRQATVRALYLDETARILLDAYRVGQPRFLDDVFAAEMAATLLQPKHVNRSWEHFLRRAESAGTAQVSDAS